MRHGYFNLNIGRVLLPPLHWCNGNVTLGNAINSGEVRLETDEDDDDDDGGGGSCDGGYQDDWICLCRSENLLRWHVSKRPLFALCDPCSAPLDGAKKPWDRANSADRSMVSRWELEAAQLDLSPWSRTTTVNLKQNDSFFYYYAGHDLAGVAVTQTR